MRRAGLVAAKEDGAISSDAPGLDAGLSADMQVGSASKPAPGAVAGAASGAGGCGAVADLAAEFPMQEQGGDGRVQPTLWVPVSIQELRALPWGYVKQPMLWPPRALKDSRCAICCGFTQEAAQSLDAVNANLLLFHSAQRLPRVPQAAEGCSDVQTFATGDQAFGEAPSGGRCS